MQLKVETSLVESVAGISQCITTLKNRENKFYQCKWCDEVYESKEDMLKHKTDFHKILTQTVSTNEHKRKYTEHVEQGGKRINKN